MIKSNNIFSIQGYCDEFLGFCPITRGDKDELREILEKMGYEDLWDYPLMGIDRIVENKLDVVLVDTSYVDDETSQLVSEYRWVEVPKIRSAIFVSVWDDGFEIETNCKVNTETKEITDIEVVDGVDEDGEELEILVEEYIIIGEEKFSAGRRYSGADYWYE